MNEVRPLVGYAFAYVRRQLQSIDELNANAPLRRQRDVQLNFAKTSGRRISGPTPDWSTNRTAPFVSREKFREAVEAARGARADLLLADIWELMARTKRNRIGQCADALDALDINVWDASLGRTWQSMTQGERRTLVISAAQVNKARSETVKAGIRLSRLRKVTVSNTNYKQGNLANRRNADQRAHRLRDFVLEALANLSPGEELSPSALAATLNAAGISSARGGRWSHNTAKDLIARIGTLPVGQTPT